MAKFSSRIDPEPKHNYVARRPIMCAAYGCPNAGTITDSTRHSEPEDATWYCRDHWGDRGQSVAPSSGMRPAGDYR